MSLLMPTSSLRPLCALVLTIALAAPSFSGRTWRSGQLRDSDPFVGSMTGTAQQNYAVAFEMSVP